MIKNIALLLGAAMLLAACSTGMVDSMNTQQAAQVIERKAAELLTTVPRDAPEAAPQDVAELKCGYEMESAEDTGVTVSRQYIVRPTTPEMAERVMEGVTAELLRQGHKIETDNRDEPGPQVILHDPADDFRTTISAAIPGTRVTFTIGSPCVAPV